MVDDDLEVAVGTALVLERVLDLRHRALERREVVLAHRCGRIGVEDRLGIFEAHRRPGVDGEALVLLDANVVARRRGADEVYIFLQSS